MRAKPLGWDGRLDAPRPMTMRSTRTTVFEAVLLIREVEGYAAMPSYTQYLVDGHPVDPATIEPVSRPGGPSVAGSGSRGDE